MTSQFLRAQNKTLKTPSVLWGPNPLYKFNEESVCRSGFNIIFLVIFLVIYLGFLLYSVILLSYIHHSSREAQELNIHIHFIYELVIHSARRQYIRRRPWRKRRRGTVKFKRDCKGEIGMVQRPLGPCNKNFNKVN